MSLEFLPPLGPIQEPRSLEMQAGWIPPASRVALEASGFTGLVAEGLSNLDQRLRAGQVELQQVAQGEGGSVHELMVRLEESRLAFQLVLQVRNRLLESYQELSRMQI